MSDDLPSICPICRSPLPQARTGRPRRTCSDRCRQAFHRRYDYRLVEDRRFRQRQREAERTLRAVERDLGPLDDTGSLSLRARLKIRLGMGQPIPYCRQCRRPYLREAGLPDFCSHACRALYHRHDAAVQQGLRDFDRHEMDGRVFVRLRLGLPLKVCEHCGRPFPPYYPRRRFCSDRCRLRHWRESRRTCPSCGVRFTPRDSRHKYCSRECSRRGILRTPLAKRDCLYCGETFTRTRSNRRYCSKRCSTRASGGTPFRPRAHDPRPCAHCGQPFTPDPNNAWKQRFCSSECRYRSRYPVAERRCELCDTPFTTAIPTKKYCSRKCYKRADYLRNRAP